jgi:hypothetical protein
MDDLPPIKVYSSSHVSISLERISALSRLSASLIPLKRLGGVDAAAA